MNKVKKWVVGLFSCLLCLALTGSLWAKSKVELPEKKKSIDTTFATLLTPADSATCDLMVMLNGTEIECRIMEINKNKIVYKLCDTTKTKVFSINKRDIVYVERMNGEELYEADLAAIGIENATDAKPKVKKKNEEKTTETEAEKETEEEETDEEENELNIFSVVSPVSALLAGIFFIIALGVGLTFSGAGLLSFILALAATALGAIGLFTSKEEDKPKRKFWMALGLGVGAAILITLGALFLK